MQKKLIAENKHADAMPELAGITNLKVEVKDGRVTGTAQDDFSLRVGRSKDKDGKTLYKKQYRVTGTWKIDASFEDFIRDSILHARTKVGEDTEALEITLTGSSRAIAPEFKAAANRVQSLLASQNRTTIELNGAQVAPTPTNVKAIYEGGKNKGVMQIVDAIRGAGDNVTL